jgi:hypothetical protein
MRYISSLSDQETRIATIRSVNYVLAQQKVNRRVYETHLSSLGQQPHSGSDADPDDDG